MGHTFLIDKYDKYLSLINIKKIQVKFVIGKIKKFRSNIYRL